MKECQGENGSRIAIATTWFDWGDLIIHDTESLSRHSFKPGVVPDENILYITLDRTPDV